ncbi:hypothetical protein EVAR_5815_1 [Eumeta japonica]|uniref:Uncharacterized protein n=1 Tax=Eumeta variegata TaxID=151549 RepID=A0A4C1T7X4_EUMVA|nr:hypothetical protein EVAR_5815_1 [Eumeta japonica]
MFSRSCRDAGNGIGWLFRYVMTTLYGLSHGSLSTSLMRFYQNFLLLSLITLFKDRRAFFTLKRPAPQSGGARRRRRRRPPTASRLKGPRKQKSFAYKLLKRGLANLMSPTSTSSVAPPLLMTLIPYTTLFSPPQF